MTIEPSTIIPFLSVVIALLGLGIAAYAVVIENRRSRFSLGVDLALRLDDRFNGSSMRELRRRAAKGILGGTYKDVDEVLDFFETLAICAQGGAIDAKVTWDLFGYWIDAYLFAGKPRIEEVT